MLDRMATPIDLMCNCVMLEVEDVDIDIRTGVYLGETGRRQPLRISVRAWMDIPNSFHPDTELHASLDYLRLRDAITALPVDRHFSLIEAVAEELVGTIFRIDRRIEMVEVKVIKLALSTRGQRIGIRVRRTRDRVSLTTFG